MTDKAALEPKIFVVPFRSTAQDGAALKAALQLAAPFGGQVQAWNVLPHPLDVATSLSRYESLIVPGSAYIDVQKLQTDNEKSRAVARDEFFELSKGANGAAASFHALTGNVDILVAEKGRLADIVVTGRSSVKFPNADIIEAALFRTGKPLFLVPPGHAESGTGHVLICWNGTPEAARAVAFALPYMQAKKVSILSVEHFPGEFASTGAELAAYLQAHGITAQVLPQHGTADSTDKFFPAHVRHHAKEIGADFIVMGAWGHNRLQEYVLGGVTDYVLDEMDIPVFLAH